MDSIWTALLKRPRIVWMLIAAITIFGIQSFIAIPRETAPTVEIPSAVVSTIWPGAGVADVEELVTNVIERKIDGLENVLDYSSSSRSGLSVISVEFESGTDLEANIQELKDLVEESVSDLPDLPSDPTVTEVSISDVPVLSLTLSGDYAWSELRQFATVIEDTLEGVNQVKRVEVSGAPEPAVHILVDPVLMQATGVSITDVTGALQSQSIDLPLGQAEVGGQRIEISLKGQLETVPEFLEIPLKSINGSVVRLRDVATVRREFAEFTVQSYFTQGGDAFPAVNMDIIKSASKGNAIVMVEEAIDSLDELKEKGVIPPGLNVTITYDRADEIRDSLGTLTDSGSQTLLLIMFVMFIALGWRESLLSGLSIPLSLLLAIMALMSLGETFNGISLFALVLAVGLLVDNSIIIVEGMSEGVAKGQTPYQAAVETINTFKGPILTGTLTTVFAFLPMLFFITGVSGDYVSVIPTTVILVLAGALFVSLFLLPAVGIAFYSGNESATWIAKWGLLAYLFWGVIAVIQVLMGTFGTMLNWLMTGAGLLLIGGLIWLIKRYGHYVWFPWEVRSEDWSKLKTWIISLFCWGLFAGTLFLLMQYIAAPLLYVLLAIWGLYALGFIRWQYGMFLRWCYRIYPIFMEWILKSGWRNGMLILISFAALAGGFGLVATKQVPVEVFPASEFPYFSGELEMPEGTSLNETAAMIPVIEEALAPYFVEGERGEKWIESLTFIAGGRSTLVQEPGDVRGGSESNILGISVELSEDEMRVAESFEMAPIIENSVIEAIPEYASFRVLEQSGGPPSGAPIEIRLQGDDISRLDILVSELLEEVKAIPELENVRDTRADRTLSLDWKFDREVMSSFGLTPAQVAQALRASTDGVTVITLTEGSEEIDVNVRIDWQNGTWTDPKSLDVIGATPLKTPTGGFVTLDQIATPIMLGRISQVRHLDGQPILVIRADLPTGITASEISDDIQEIIDSVELLAGESVELGGEAEEGNRLINEMILAMSFAALLILMVLVWQFQSFHQAVVVLLLIPLSLTGVFVGFWLTGRTITFPTMIGIVSLAGIIVNDAIVLIDQLNHQVRKSSDHKYMAWITAGISRFQPILLTSITTVVGMLPLSLSDPIWGGLGFAIIYGMAISTILCLVLAPCLLRFWDDIIDLRAWLWDRVSSVFIAQPISSDSE